MQLDLKKLFDAEEQVLPFSMELDLSGVEQWGDRPFKTSIAIKGEVQNRAGIVTVRYDADYILSASCARCLEPVEQKKHQEFLDTLAQDDILLELPIRMLCSEDCKGLCPMCGCNLNKETCSCQEPVWETNRRVKAFDNLEWSDEEEDQNLPS